MIVVTDKGVAALPLSPDQENPPNVPPKELLDEAVTAARRALRERGCINVTEDDGKTSIGVFGYPEKVVIDRKARAAYSTNPVGSFSLFNSKRKAATVFQSPFPVAENVIVKHLKERGFQLDANNPDESLEKRIRHATLRAINSAFRSNMRDILRQFGSAVWSKLDRDLLRGVIRAAGFSADSLDYTIFWHNREDALETFRIAPGVMPLWLFTAHAVMIERHGHDGFTRAHAGRHKVEARMDALDFRMPPIVPDMQRRLSLSPRGWRYLIGLNPMWTRELVKLQIYRESVEAAFKEIAYMVEMLATVGTVGSYSSFKTFTTSASAWVNTSQLVALARAAFRASLRRKGRRTFAGHEMKTVLDWFAEARPTLDKNQLKASWTWFIGQRDEWRARELERKRARTEYREWPSLLENFAAGEYELVALTNTHALLEEGSALHHCVGDYADRCARGTTRIFSLRSKTGERLATVELTNSGFRPGSGEWLGHNWVCAQVKGKYNATFDVSPAMLEAIESLRCAYQERAVEAKCPPPQEAEPDDDLDIFF